MTLLRRSPLKIKTRLAPGNKPLETKKPLPSGTKPVKKRSSRMQRFYEEERIPFVIEFLADHPLCEIRWDDGCQGIAVDVDEIKLRSRERILVPKNRDFSNFQSTCRHCHIQKTSNPAEAKRRGLTR
jgi:hypothetical protein